MGKESGQLRKGHKEVAHEDERRKVCYGWASGGGPSGGPAVGSSTLFVPWNPWQPDETQRHFLRINVLIMYEIKFLGFQSRLQ